MIEGTADAEYRSGPTRFRIIDEALVCDSSRGGTEQSISLGDVRHVRIYVTQGRAFCLVNGSSGKPIVIATAQGGSNDEADEYVGFVEAVHARIAEASPGAKFRDF